MDNVKYLVPENLGKETSESIYSENHRIILQSSETEERERVLRVSLGHVHKHISLQLTDDQDPCFLYNLIITEEDFKALKCQQNLLVDLAHFPVQFVKLLEKCKNDIGTAGPKFMVLLATEGEGSISRSIHLQIIEKNFFKNLCHLDLNMSIGSDAEVKKLMAFQIKNLKETVTLSQKELAHTSSRLDECIQDLELKRIEEEKRREKNEEESRKMFVCANAEINKLKEELVTSKLQWQTEENKRMEDVQSNREENRKRLESEIAQISAENHKLFEKNSKFEKSKRELNDQLEAVQRELTASQVDLVALKKQSAKIDVDYHAQNKLVASQKFTIRALERELRDTKALLSQQVEYLTAANQEKARLEKESRERETFLRYKQDAVMNISTELVNANGIIAKLRAKNNDLNMKLEQRTQIALQQEQFLRAKNTALNLSEKTVKHLTINLKAVNFSEKSLKEQLETAKENIRAQEKHIGNNKITIKYLLRQLATQDGRRRVPSPTSIIVVPDTTGPPPEEPRSSLESLPPFIFAADPMNTANLNIPQEPAGNDRSIARRRIRILAHSSRPATAPLHTASTSAAGAPNVLPNNNAAPSTVTSENSEPTSVAGASNTGTRRPSPYPNPSTMSAYFPGKPK